MSLLDLASLVLSPTATKEGKVYSAIPDTGEGDMTFTRGSAATRINSAGLIEKERGNLLTYSNDFSQSIWQKLNNAVVSGQTATDPFGNTNSAWDVVFDGTTSCRIEQSISGVINGGVYASSIWARTKSGTQDVSFGSVFTENFTLTTEWQRISLFEVENDTVAYVRLACNDAVTLEVYAAQLEQGLVATDYIRTTTSAVYEGITDDVPRVDYSGGGCPSLLLESQRSNLVTNSEYVSSSDYVTGNWTGTITTNTSETLSPEGLYNATKFVKSGSTDRVYFQTSVSDGTYTGSMYFKAVSGQEGNTVEISVRRFGGGSGSTTKLITLTSEWQRVDVTATLSGGTNTAIYIADFSSSGNANSFYFYGLQLEAGSYITSYIPTYSVSSTRVADSCSKTGISELIGQTEGTMFCEMGEDVNFGTVTTSIFCLDDNTANNRIELSITPTGNGRISFYISNGGTEQVNILSVSTLSANDKIAVTYKANDFVVYLNGTAIDTDTSGSVPTTNVARIAQRYDGGRTEKNSFKQAILFPTRLTNDQLSELTK